MNRTYGKLWLDPETKLWTIKAEPHIMIKVKQVFGKVDKGQFGHVTLFDSDEVRRDLEWFLSRYDLEVADQDWAHLFDGSERHKAEVGELESIMAPDYKAPAFAMALPPRDYQAQVAEIVWKRGFLLVGDQVGLGKTVETIACFTNPDTLPALVVTLAGILPSQWEKEVNRFMPGLTTHVIKKTKPYPFPLKNGKPPDVLITSYSKLHGWAEHLAGKLKMIAFDEAQELRHNTSNKYKAAKHIARTCKFVCGLSATPIFGYGGEIYNVIDVLRENILGAPDEFFREWCSTAFGERKVSIRDPRAFGTYLREQFIMIRRTRGDVGRELPALQRIPHRIASDRSALDSVKESAAALAKIILSTQKLSGFERMKAAEEFSHLLRQATGISKCLAPGTPVLKFDGSSEAVENLRVGDLLMGPDSKPRTITALASGRGEMYEVSSTSQVPLFAPYAANGDHILALKRTGKHRYGDRFLFTPYIQGDHLEISIRDYLSKTKHFKHMVKGYKIGVEFPEQPLPLDPYFFGLWLGDGTSREPSITTADIQIKKYIYKFAKSHGLFISVHSVGRTAPTYRISTKMRGGLSGKNGFLPRHKIRQALKNMGVLFNKHIPENYLVNSRENRMKLLAGLLDTDGYLNRPGVYTISSKWKHLGDQICRLVWSLGFSCKMKKRIVSNQTKRKFVAYSMCISGNGLEDLPVLLPRRKSPKRRQIKDPLRSGISVRPVGVGNYHGFSLDGDGLFLLSDYTVTHNSPYVADFVRMMAMDGDKVVVFAWHRQVYDVLLSKLQDLNPVMITGAESEKQKIESKKRFVSGDSQVLLISLRAGQGIDGLQDVSSIAVFAELDWAPGISEQCIGRLHRDGQKKPVTAFFLLADEGSDPTIAEALGLKAEQLEGIRNPDSPLVEDLQIDEDHVKTLAKQYLEKEQEKAENPEEPEEPEEPDPEDEPETETPIA